MGRNPATFTMEYGVHGAYRISTREFTTLADAEAAAARWARSNSTGHYWAEVTGTSVGGSTPGSTVTYARHNLPRPARRQ